ncbi:UDP-glucosyltransferase [Holotrichia oblita]|uniref:UDP-glucosyltransferase n=1 Tax=Holotrichia oblita TaxID=644536 RepID=A0ACB9TJ22_HOLOL|nr:UDP-glucosyltransferase [Holotrichia oblita]
MKLCLFVVLGLCVHGIPAANILIVGLLDSVSHRIWYEQLIGGLVEKGHNITLLSYADAKLKVDNYTVIKFPPMDVTEEIQNEMTNTETSFLQNLSELWMWLEVSGEIDLQTDSMRTILDYPRDKFDLIMFEMFNGQHLYHLVDYFGNPPVIGISPLGLSPNILDAMGGHSFSYYPIYCLRYNDQMNLLQRAQNWIMYLIDNYYKWTNIPRLEKLAQDKFGKDITRVHDIEKRIQILLANYDPILDYPIPLPPYIIPVGGLHTKRSTPLENDLQKILDNANQGVIYFALGTIVRPSVLPMEKKKMFLDAFSKLDQIVLWKYEGDDLEDVPKNVIIRKFFAQNNILAHKNVKLFITHGGGLSTQETMYNGVPIVGIPFFYDQWNNVAKMEAKNLGKGVVLQTLTSNILHDTIKEVLDNPIYSQNIKKLSKAFRSQKETPLERAVFWVENVLEHKDLGYLNTRGRSMTWYERENLDIFAFFLLLIIFVPILAVKLPIRGLNSQETMYNGVPIVGIPFFYDQWNNVAKMEAKNLGKGLVLQTLTSNVLHDTIKEILDNPIPALNMFLRAILMHYFIGASVDCANILFVSPVASPSHHIWNEVLVSGLLEKRHNITLIGHEEAKIKSTNYTVLKITGMDQVYETLNINELLYNKNTPLEDLQLLWDYIVAFADLDLNSNALERLLSYPKDAFDLIIFDIVCGHYFYPLIEYFGNPPVVVLSPFALPPYILDAIGSQFYSFFPIIYTTYTDQMTFWQRLENTFMNLCEYYYKWKNMKVMYELAQKRFGGDIVEFDKVERQFQILLANYDATVDFAIPLAPNIIPVGGLHTKRSSKLPNDLLKILNNSKQGVIFFSFGTNIHPSGLSPEKKKIFLNTFGKLKEIILWKYDGDDLEDVPKNVIIKKWYQQNDILGHKNVKLFITHSGGLSTREAMYHGVPVLGIPLFMDQLNNAEKMQVRKLGRRLFMRDLNEETLYESINDVLNNPIYKDNMKRTSELFRDQKETPLERAVYWIEYTLRHKNLSHLSVRTRDMNIYQRENLDLFGFIFVVAGVVLILICIMLKCVYKSYTSESYNKIKSD